jgi:hypothetical protein
MLLLLAMVLLGPLVPCRLCPQAEEVLTLGIPEFPSLVIGDMRGVLNHRQSKFLGWSLSEPISERSRLPIH